MKASYVTSLAVALCLSTWGLTVAADDMQPKPGVVEAGSTSFTGTVQSIDYTTREVTLKNANGKTITMQVGPEAVRFNEVKKGDVVKMDYLESVAVMVQSPSETVSGVQASGTAIIRNKSKLPSGTAVTTDVTTATVVKINAQTRKATLKAQDGHTFVVEVAPDVQHLENVKKGDQVVVRYTRALAVSVSKPQ